MKSYNRILFIAAFLFAFIISRAQVLETTLSRYATDFQPERIHLHLDKSTYLPGETIWFKAYIMSDIFPSVESKTVYIDWIDDKGVLLSHTVGPVVDGMSNGQLDIPEDYSSHFIHIRAYTKWMLNFDTAFLFKKDIRIILKDSKSTTAKTPAPQIDLQFFPEGGDAIAGIPNTIAFKATDQWGKPVQVKGSLYANDKLVLTFNSVHDGMGVFELLPVLNTVYKAKWKDERNVEHTSLLPPVKESGIGLHIDWQNGKRFFKITRPEALPSALEKLHVLGTIHGNLVFRVDVPMAQKNVIQAAIPTAQFPSGILTITVFDSQWKAIAERIAFINNNEYVFRPALSVQRWGLNKRARNEIEIRIPDSLQSSMSVSITDAAIESDSSQTIISSLLLSGELKGYIHRPSFYFQNTSDSISRFLDLVMLTNGWRRFVWEDITAGKLPVIKYPRDSNFLFLSGKILGVREGRFGASDNIILATKGKDSATKLMVMPIGKDGSFGDPSILLFDSVRIYYQIKSKLADKGDVRFMPGLMAAPNYAKQASEFQFSNPGYDTTGNYRHKYLAEEQARALAMLQGKTLAMVTVKAKMKPLIQQMDEKYAKGLFSGGDVAGQFDLVNDPFAAGRPDVFSYLQGKVAGLMINQTTGQTSLQWRGGSPQLYLDEMRVDIEMVQGMPVSDIAYVKVFRPPFMGSFGGGGNGAIAIYTRRGDDIINAPGKGLQKNVVTGYSLIRQFYSPNYASFDKKNDQPDIRSTLYWNPTVTTSPKKPTTTLVFYNNDVSRSFRIVIEGMTKDGLLTHYEEVLE